MQKPFFKMGITISWQCTGCANHPISNSIGLDFSRRTSTSTKMIDKGAKLFFGRISCRKTEFLSIVGPISRDL